MDRSCKTFRGEIEEAVGGAWLSRSAEAHLEACRGCLDFFKEREALRLLVGKLDRVEAPGDFEFRLRARMSAAKNAERRRIPRFARGFASAALVACVALAITVAFYFKRPTVEYQTTAQQPPPPANVTPVMANIRSEAFRRDVNNTIAEVQVVEKVVAAQLPRRLQRRNTQPRFINVGTAPSSARASGEMEFGLRSAQVIEGSNVRLKVSAEPLPVVLRDETGAARRVTMKPVSFGAQNLVGRAREVSSASVADKEGVW